MIIEKIAGPAGTADVGKIQVAVPFEWFELEKKRIKKTAADGMEMGICVDEKLKNGDVLCETEDKAYVVQIQDSMLICIHVDTMEQMGRLGFELGNRHLSLQITEHEVYVPFDQPTYEYLLHLGFQAVKIQGIFEDFIQCRAHGHSHEHTHDHGHTRSHEHTHTHEHAHGHFAE